MPETLRILRATDHPLASARRGGHQDPSTTAPVQRRARASLAVSAFIIVRSAFGWLVDNYLRLADWNACARRIASLMMSLDGRERAEEAGALGRIQRGETEGKAMLTPSLRKRLRSPRPTGGQAKIGAWVGV
jgi:hypothetical protein